MIATPSDQDRPIAAIVSKQRVTGSNNGSSGYLLATCKALRDSGWKVVLIQPSPTLAGRSPVLRLSTELEVVDEHLLRGAFRLGRLAIYPSARIIMRAIVGLLGKLARRLGSTAGWSVDRPAPYAVSTPWTASDHAFVARHMPVKASLVIADYIFCTPAFSHAPPKARTAILMHDLFHARGAGELDSVAQLEKSKEIEMLKQADAVFAIQPRERDFVTHNAPHTSVLLVPMPAEPVAEAIPGDDDRILFVGSLTSPNVVGLEWFLENAWPSLREARPSLVLDVAGTVGRAFPDRLEGVNFLGLVQDLASLYERAGIVISPLTFGSGLKIKLIEAMARGKAVVATSITLQGVDDVCGEAVMIANDHDEFVDAILTMCSDPSARQRAGDRALRIVHRFFTSATTHKELHEWLNSNPAVV